VVDAVVVPDLAGCPQCTGPWMRSLTFDHANTCTLRDQQDATADEVVPGLVELEVAVPRSTPAVR
jgi:hypothetical protein